MKLRGHGHSEIKLENEGKTEFKGPLTRLCSRVREGTEIGAMASAKQAEPIFRFRPAVAMQLDSKSRARFSTSRSRRDQSQLAGGRARRGRTPPETI